MCLVLQERCNLQSGWRELLLAVLWLGALPHSRFVSVPRLHPFVALTMTGRLVGCQQHCRKGDLVLSLPEAVHKLKRIKADHFH